MNLTQAIRRVALFSIDTRDMYSSKPAKQTRLRKRDEDKAPRKSKAPKDARAPREKKAPQESKARMEARKLRDSWYPQGQV